MKYKYNEERPLITIRSDLNKEIMRFIKNLKKKNKCSKWINDAILKKYKEDKK